MTKKLLLILTLVLPVHISAQEQLQSSENIDPRLKILQDFQARGKKDKEAIFTEILRTQDMCFEIYQQRKQEREKIGLQEAAVLTLVFLGTGALITLTGFVVKSVMQVHYCDFAKGRERGYQEGYQIGFHTGVNTFLHRLHQLAVMEQQDHVI